MHKPLLILTAAAMLADTPLASDHFEIQHANYQEDAGRVGVAFSTLKLEQDFGSDHSLKLQASYDAISGASPAWQPLSALQTASAEAIKKAAGQVLYGHALGQRYAVQKVPLHDRRQAIAADWTARSDRRDEWTLGAAYSKEQDFASQELSLQARINHDASRNLVWLAGLATQHNRSDAFNHDFSKRSEAFTMHSGELGLSLPLSRQQILEARLFAAREQGFLSNHYQTVLRQDENTVYLAADSRPGQRQSGGLSGRLMQGFGPQLATQLSYRYYRDSWEIRSHTLEAQLHWQINEYWQVSPAIRGYRQTAAYFYKPWQSQHAAFGMRDEASHDERLGRYSAHTLSLNSDWRLNRELQLIMGLSHYRQGSGLRSNWWSLGLRYGH